MHHAGIGRVPEFLGEDARHVLIRRAGMDDQRQSGLLRRRDMDAQAFLLHLRGLGGVVIIEAGLADADEFRMRRQRDKIVHRRQRLLCRTHRMGARGIEHLGVRLGDGAHGGLLPKPRADRHHAVHTRSTRARDHLVQITVEIGKVEVAMAVGDADIAGHGPPMAGSLPGGLIDPEHGI